MPEGHAKGEQVRPEYVVAAVGKVRLREQDAINPKMPTGEIEIEATELRVLNDTRLAPFSPSEEAIQNEEVRLKYRYIDLRRARDAAQLPPAPRDHAGHSREPEPAGISRDRNADPDQVHARGRARFSGAQPRASRRVLRAAAVAADLQADPDDLGLRPLFPDCPLLPRRGPARRPPARVHAGRSGDELSAPGDGLRRGRAVSEGGLCRGRRRPADSVPAHHLRRVDAPVRHRQARPAPARTHRRALGVHRRSARHAADRSRAAHGGAAHSQAWAN